MGINVVTDLGDIPIAQNGYFTRAQAAGQGVADFDLTRAVGRGYIRRVGHGVYRVTGAGHDHLAELRVAWLRLEPARSSRQRLMDPNTWVSHESAASVHGFGVFLADRHTFTAKHRVQAPTAVRIYRRSRGLDRHEWTALEGFAVTTVVRTASDLLAAHADGGHIGRLLSDALGAGAVRLDELEQGGLASERIESLMAQGS